MYRIQTLNKISPLGLDLLPKDRFEVASEHAQPDAIIVRSASLHGAPLAESLKGIARAGAGYNNIPVDECTKKGIVVFNTPGANANAVKELVIAGLLLSSRKIYQGMTWVASQAGAQGIEKLIEDKKSEYAGPEILGKTLGIIGLGAIGVLVANAAVELGMDVVGYDPYLTIDNAWNLTKCVRRTTSLESLLTQADYLTIHIPMDDSSKGFIGKEKIALMKKGVRILNFARGGLVNNKDLLQGIKEGKVAAYVTDFPNEELVGVPDVLAIPHLGASTPESEDNCAKMAALQVKALLESGSIRNSVNFPACSLEPVGAHRITVAACKAPDMGGKVSAALEKAGIKTVNSVVQQRGEVGYGVFDTDKAVSEDVRGTLGKIEGVTAVRCVIC